MIKLWQQILSRIHCTAAAPQTNSFWVLLNSLPVITNQPASCPYSYPQTHHITVFGEESFPEIPCHSRVFWAESVFSANGYGCVIFSINSKQLSHRIFLIKVLQTCVTLSKNVYVYVEELLSVVWMAPLLTQTQGLWVALSVLLYFNRLPGTGDENNFLLVYLRNSYSNYGNTSQTNFHIFSVSSLIWVFSLHFTTPFHQGIYHIQTVWWMRRNTTKNGNHPSRMIIFEFLISSVFLYHHKKLSTPCLATSYQGRKKHDMIFSFAWRVRSSWKGTSLLIGTLTYFPQRPIFLSCLSDLYHTYSYILQHSSWAWKTHTIHITR